MTETRGGSGAPAPRVSARGCSIPRVRHGGAAIIRCGIVDSGRAILQPRMSYCYAQGEVRRQSRRKWRGARPKTAVVDCSADAEEGD